MFFKDLMNLNIDIYIKGGTVLGLKILQMIYEKHPDKINWVYLSGNPNAIHILEKNIDKIDWHMLSINPNAIHILEKYTRAQGLLTSCRKKLQDHLLILSTQKQEIKMESIG
jgi:hypothetical protein